MDRGVFFLAATVVGAGIGYFIGKSQDDDAPTVAKVLGIWDSRKGPFTAVGALSASAVAVAYLYIELMFRAVIWGGEACMNHPIRALVVTAVVIGVLAFVGASQDAGNKSSKGRKVLNQRS